MMGLGINLRESEGVTILELNGKLVFGKEVDTLREQVRQLLAANKRKIVLNLGKVSYSDSVGLGCLVASSTSVRTQGGQLKLVHLSRRVREVLDLTHLTPFFDVCASEDEALSSFK